jgi:hypothetical protein
VRIALALVLLCLPTAARAATLTVNGTQAPPTSYGSVTQALAVASCGDVIALVDSLVSNEQVRLTNKGDCTANPIYIQSARWQDVPPPATASNVPLATEIASFIPSWVPTISYNVINEPTIADGSGSGACNAPKGYHFRGLNITQGTASNITNVVAMGHCTFSALSNLPNTITFERVYIHAQATPVNDAGGACVRAGGTNLTFKEVYLFDCKSRDYERQAIVWFYMAGLTIKDSLLSAAGEITMSGGNSAQEIAAHVPSDISIVRNRYIQPKCWNAFDTANFGTVASGCAAVKNAPASTMSSVGTTVTLSAAAGGCSSSATSICTLAGALQSIAPNWIERLDTGERAQITAGSGTSFTIHQAFPSGNAPAGTSYRILRNWLTKNLLEFKSGTRVTVRGNDFMHAWHGEQQQFYAVVVKSTNQGGNTPLQSTDHVTIQDNVFRSIYGALSMGACPDFPCNQATAGRSHTIKNNLWLGLYDSGSGPSGGADIISIAWGTRASLTQTYLVDGLVFKNNTMALAPTPGLPSPRYVALYPHHTNTLKISSGDVSNNIFPHGSGGLKYQTQGTDNGISDFTDTASVCSTAFNAATTTSQYNYLIGGASAAGHQGNWTGQCATTVDNGTTTSIFVSHAHDNLRLLTPNSRLGSDGRPVGVDFQYLLSARVRTDVVNPAASTVSPSRTTPSPSAGTAGRW